LRVYGGCEPAVRGRAWLSGAESLLVPQLLVQHVFKPQEQRAAFIREVRPSRVANGLRFGLLYASEEGALQLLRYYALKFPILFRQAFAAVGHSDLWERRARLQAEL